ncbi:MAG: low molecular weight protein-tyrosine-phosphatase [Arachnia sp.]
MAHLVFVCWGNICRSPMAERVARKVAADEGLDLDVESFALSAEELGNPIDRRAARTLTAAGYDASGHRARQVTADDLADADLVVAVEPFQVDRLRRLSSGATVALLNDFDPAKPKGTPLVDPWYGDEAGFAETLADIEAAMPGILAALYS